MSGYLEDIVSGARSLLVGMGVTIRYMVKPVTTCQYPRETINVTPNFRGHIELVPDEGGGNKCIVCGSCERMCPSQLISLKGERPKTPPPAEGEKPKPAKKELVEYTIDFTRCSLCGLCVESCPVDAIRFSANYNLAGFTREEFHLDLLQRLREEAA
ncbi:MAG: NADH-quinone oxidoreductase subunit I [Pseudomonadota bacterium]